MTPEEFKEARESLGMSVSETAKACGVGERTVRRWEQTNRTPGPHPSACKILDYLDTGQLDLDGDGFDEME